MIKRIYRTFFKDNASLSTGWLLLRGISWLMIGIVFGRLLMFITRIMAARLLGKDALGEFGLIESTVTMFVAYAGLGMTVAISKNLAESFQTDALRAGRVLGIVLMLSGSLFLLLLLFFLGFSQTLAEKLSDNPRFLLSLRIGALLALQVPGALALAILNAFQAFRQVALANIIQGMVTLSLTIVLAPWFGLNGIISAFGLGMLLMFLYQFIIISWLCRKHSILIKFDGLRKEFPLIWRYGLPSMLGGIFIGPVTWGTRVILAKQEGGLADLGIYIAAVSLCAVLITISTLLSNVTIPVLSAAKTLEERHSGILRSIFLYWSAALGLVVPLIALSDHIVHFLLGPDFLNTGPVLAIVALAVSIRIFYTSFGSTLIVLDRVWHMTSITMAADPIFLVWTIFLAPLWGAQGLAVASLITSLIVLIILYAITERVMGWGKKLPHWFLLMTLLFLGMAWLIKSIHIVWLAILATSLLLSCFIVVLLYLALHYDLLGALATKVPFLMRIPLLMKGR